MLGDAMKDDSSDDVYYKVAYTLTERIMYAVAGGVVGTLFGFCLGRYLWSEGAFWLAIILSVVIFGGLGLVYGKRFWKFVGRNWPYFWPW